MARTQDDDEDLAKALRLSKEEEELRRRELEEQNAQALFDDTPVQPAQVQPTGFNQGYQQQGAVDWFGNPINPQQPLSTGYLNNQYAQPTGFQPQPTGFANGYGNGLQGQPNAFDPSQYGQYPNAYLQPQQTAFNTNNPYGTTDIFAQQPQQAQQQQLQSPQESFPSAGSNNPWATNNQPSADGLKPMPTGSNNPFAARTQQYQSTPQPTGPPSLSTLAEERATSQFSAPNPIANYQAPAPAKAMPSQAPQNPHHARLNALLASGEGLDTFGNVGDLRIPAQHTAPGNFVNSAGQGLDRLHAAQTGNNPFFKQQFTGMPQQTGFVQNNSNPWGSQQPHPQQQQQGGSSLIDL